ncbi:MAG: hypothetical protein GY769_11790 [bacterium]|nr:hypothetical protein [bacterium]
MKLSDYLEDLDPKLAANLERALESVRREFEDKLAATVEQTVTAVAEEAAALAAEAAAAAEAPEVPAAPAPAAAISLEAADELRLATLDIDVAASQSEILEALSRGVLRFASRVAIFVHRGPEAHGWSAAGFGEADGRIKEVSLGGDVPFPMADHLNEGSIALSAEDCALICDALAAGHPSMGLLMPFVLGNQVVGMVYCDRVGDDVFSVSALQLLTYVAGQTLETLPVRKRESTATLSIAGGGAEVAATVETVEEVPLPPETPIPAVEELEEPASEPPLEAAMPEEAEEEYVIDSVELPEADAGLSTPEIDESPDLPPEIAAPSYEPPPSLDEEDTRPAAYMPEPPSPAETLPPPIEQPTELPPVAQEPPKPVTAEPTLGLSSTQVAPPDDLQGPGWAFTSTTGEPSEASSESEHEEAQRLARLLVTEIKLYNEEAVEEGRRDANVYTRLQEDIDRSRQIFEDRIDPAVRDEDDYFKQALVRILAGGDPSLLGI